MMRKITKNSITYEIIITNHGIERLATRNIQASLVLATMFKVAGKLAAGTYLLVSKEHNFSIIVEVTENFKLRLITAITGVKTWAKKGTQKVMVA